MNPSKQIKFGAVMSYAMIVINIMASFLYTPWMIRQIGQSDYGLYALANSFISFFLIDIGMGEILCRHISLYKAKSQEGKIHNVIGTAFKIYLVLDLVVALVLLVVYLNIQNVFVELTPKEIERFKTVFLIVGGFNLISFPLIPVNGIYSGYERFAALKLFDIVAKLITIFSVIIALSMGMGLYSLVLANTLFHAFIKILQLVYIRKKEKFKINIHYRNRGFVREMLKFSFWMLIISISKRFIININPSVIGALSGAVQVSIFAVGSSIEGYTWMFSNALSGLFLPKVTRLSIQEHSVEEINMLLQKVGRLQLLIAGIIICGFASMGYEFINLWMGEGFSESYFVGLFLILPGIVTLTQEIAMNYLVAINEVKWRTIDYVGTAIFCLILSSLLTPKYGAVGAAFSAGSGMILGHVIIMNIIYQKRFGLNMCKFFKECHLKFAPAFVLMFFVGLALQNFIPVKSLFGFFIKASIWLVLYGVCMWFLGMNQSEKNLIFCFGRVLKTKLGKRQIKKK